jgi:alpha-galactosidase
VTSRREFLEASALLAATRVVDRARAYANLESHAPRGFIDLRRAPDAVTVQTADGDRRLVRDSADHWTDRELVVATTPGRLLLHVGLTSPTAAVKRIHLRWRGDLSATRLVLGDAWERAYGDLEWRGWTPDRVMPWYCATFDGSLTHAYGVRTGASSFCFWQIDPQGISLWADVRSGGVGVQLDDRTLDVCDVVCRAGHDGESSFATLHAFCHQMCPPALPPPPSLPTIPRAARLPRFPLYGSNDWYWAYGRNTAETVRADAAHVVELSPAGENRPFVVIDDGWQPGRGADKSGTGTWDHGNEKFGDMAALAADIRRAGAKPGIWIRPLQAPSSVPDAWRLSRDRAMLDPTVPEVRQKVVDDLSRIRTWGFDLIKHDYSTYDIFGRWGFQMGAAMTRDGWSFASGSSRTTAEVINDLYSALRTGAGDALVIGCNTVSHLSAGVFEICRIGDDTSGTEWARTRKMGVNTLAFRGAQHGAFYVADADCVGVTNAVPWAMNRQWLDLLSRSGTMLFVSLAPDALGAEQRRDLTAALARAASPQPLGEPVDWQRSVYPSRWRLEGREVTYDWVGADGAGPP